MMLSRLLIVFGLATAVASGVLSDQMIVAGGLAFGGAVIYRVVKRLGL